MDNIITLDRHVDLVFSPDDGWYFQDYRQDDTPTSRTYATKEEALEAYRKQCIVWDRMKIIERDE